MQEKISVIVPVYNVSRYLERCVNSIINQTYNNLQIILVNDGSTDDSGVLCDNLAKLDNRISVIHKENGGLADARNSGLKVAAGEYIAFLDSDDWIDLDYYEILHRKIIETKSDIAVIGFLWVKGEKFVKPSFYLEDQVLSNNEAIKELAKDELLTSHAWNKLFRKEVLRGIEFPYGRTYEDIFIMHKVFEKAKRIAIISDFKHYYYMHNESIIHTPSAKNVVDEYLAFKNRFDDLKDKYADIRGKMADLVCARIVQMYYVNPLTKEEKKVYSKEISEAKAFIKNKDIMYNLGLKRKILSFSPEIYEVCIKIKRILPDRIKEVLKATMSKPKGFTKLNNGEKRIILCGSPEYGNIGDLAIAYFTNRFMKINSNKQFVEISENELHKYFNQIVKQVKPNDILLLQGGGNLGSEYVDQENIRSKVINTFKNNKIIIMPQTIYFSKDNHGEKVKSTIKDIYSKHTNLNIFSRETISFKTMKEVFNKNNINLVPDIVMSSTVEFENVKRDGAMLCLRSDVEGILNVDDLIKIKTTVSKKFNNYYMNDTVYDTDISLEQREGVLFDFWSKMRKAEVVVTDRLHGMVFATITGTPCVVIGNYNHKVKTCYNWFKDLGYVEFCNNIDEVEVALNKIDYSKTYTYPGKEMMDKFESMKKLIGEE